MHRAKALAPLILVLGIDLWFTLAGQPVSYWQGKYGQCVEMSPWGRALLQAGPTYFVGAYTTYTLIVCLLVGRMRKSLDNALVMAVLLGHAWGSSTWLSSMLRIWLDADLTDSQTWHLHLGYIVVIALLCGICFHQVAKKVEICELCRKLQSEAQETKALEPSP